jgi:hypothetical protein
VTAGPALSVSIHTRNSESRLERLVAEARRFADEVVLGVDADSSDGTFELASRIGDVAYRFRHPGYHAPARILALDFARGDWIFSLDDDEAVDRDLPGLLPELLADARYTHYWFPRKWIVQSDPAAYLRASPWFPDWQLRLFRNDRSIVWKPPAVHTGYRVMGTGAFEDRSAILHYEPILRTPQERSAKIARYRALGSSAECEAFYRTSAGPTPVRLEVPALEGNGSGLPAAPRVHAEPIPFEATGALPPWRHRIAVRAPPSVSPGNPFLAELLAENPGPLAWLPPGRDWPHLNASYHLYAGDGRLLRWDGERFPVPRIVCPGERARILCSVVAPAAPGDYVLEWDLVSEGECWFAQCGSAPARQALSVEPPRSPGAVGVRG